jgi:capsular exopolysaccharide synthesis family protein
MSMLTRVPPQGPPTRYEPRTRRAAQPEWDDGFELRRLVRALLRRKAQIAIVTLLVLGPVAAWTFLTEPLYRASTLVSVDPDPVQVLPYREIDRPSLSSTYELFMKSQDELLKSPVLVARVAERLKTEPDAAALAPELERLGARLSVARIENTQIIRLGYLSPSPEVAARVANMYAEEYLRRQFESGEQIREKARQLLQRELELLEARVQKSERELVAYAQAHRLSPNRTTDSAVQQKQALIEKQTAEAEAAVFAARSRLEGIQNATADDFPQALVTPVISTLVTRLLQLEHDLTALRATFGENWPAVVQKRNEVALVRDQLVREKTAALAQAREQATLDYRSAENTRRLLAGSLATQQQLVNETDDASVEFNILRREVDTNQKLYAGILERLEQASVTSGADFGAIRVVEPASPPGMQDSPKVAWNLALGTLLGLAFGVCLALARDYWDRSLTTVEEVEEVTRLPVLGSVPAVVTPANNRIQGRRWRAALPGGRRDRGPTSTTLSLRTGSAEAPASDESRLLSTDAAAAEAVRNICASILLSRPGQPPRVLLVTSTLPGEGKSTIAAELALMLAERGLRTLLVECDLRRPNLARRYNISPKGGLTLWLAGIEATPPTQHALSPGLSIVSAGPPTPNPVVLLGSERMREYIAHVRQSFEFVILDAPPVMGLADARVLAPMAEGVIVVVRAGTAQKPSIERACDLLDSAGAQVIGVVLNGAEIDEASSYYYRHYYTKTAG